MFKFHYHLSLSLRAGELSLRHSQSLDTLPGRRGVIQDGGVKAKGSFSLALNGAGG